MKGTSPLPQKLLLLIAAVQGLALLYLKNALESGAWPGESPAWSFPLVTLAFAVPACLLLSVESGQNRGLYRDVGLLALVLAIVAAYTGYQAEPFADIRIGELVFVFTATTGLAVFKALMYIQQRASGTPLQYQQLFTCSWRNVLTLGLSLLMTLVFFLLLQLWGALFNAIGVEFFANLFDMDWFLVPLLALANGVGIIIFRNLTGVIDSITRLMQGLIKLLLPLVVLIAAIFLAVLPFVGLDALWKTGSGTSLLLFLLAFMLFFTNAVYQDGRGADPYPLLLHRLLYAGLCLAPIIAALSFHGLWLRVAQYGWTITRSWALVAWLLLALFSVGYVIGIVRRRDAWTQDLGRVNTWMGLVVLAIMLLANSPLLDFRKLSVASQLARVESGEIELRDLDFWYFRESLARPGYLAMEEIKASTDDARVLKLMANPLPSFQLSRMAGGSDELWATVEIRPEGIVVPSELRDMIVRQFAPGHSVTLLLVEIDINEDTRPEYLLVTANNGRILGAYLYTFSEAGWRYTQMSILRGVRRHADVLAYFRSAEVTLREPRLKDVQVGDLLLRAVDAEHLLPPAGVTEPAPE
jgi:Domain of unknown function (DUF4153)